MCRRNPESIPVLFSLFFFALHEEIGRTRPRFIGSIHLCIHSSINSSIHASIHGVSCRIRLASPSFFVVLGDRSRPASLVLVVSETGGGLGAGGGGGV